MKNLSLFLTLLCVLLLSSGAHAQQIRGSVKSAASGEPLAGAIVMAEGTRAGATTNSKGEFTLTVASLPVRLEVSFVGMESRTVNVTSAERPVQVLLDETAEALDELVVIGYAVVRKSDLTGSVGQMKASQINDSRMISIEQAMAGHLAGVNIVNTSGEPGAGISINIRGVGSINSDTEPLYVIDGMPYIKDAGTEVGNISGLNSATINPMSSLNPQDIQSIEVLKDASATAIYGSRGANGVVLVTTKSGSAGKPRVSISAFVGVSEVSKKIDMLDANTFIDYMAYDRKTEQYITKGDSLRNLAPHYNWQDYLFKRAVKQEYSVGVNGGNNQGTAYSISVNYVDQNGLVKNSDYTRYGARARVDQKIGSKARAGVNLNYAEFTQVGVSSGGSKDTGSDVFQQALSYRPVNVRFNASDLDESGELSGDYNSQTNPFDYLSNALNKTNNTRTTAIAYVQYEFLKGLLFKSSFNYNTTMTNKLGFYPPSIAAGAANGGRGINAYARRYNWAWENIATYKTTFCKKHNFDALAGYTMEQQYARDYSQESQNYPEAYNKLTGVNTGLGLTVLAPVVSEWSSAMVSYFARVNYNYASRYYFTASIRADGSSKFPKGEKFGYFPSAAVAWKASEEPFMKNSKVFSDFKLRASWGLTGNQSIPAYSSLSRYQSVYYSTNTTGGLSPTPRQWAGLAVSSIANPDLTWETTKQFDAGIDISFLRHRLSATVDYYYKKTYDMLLNKPLLYSTGYSRMMYNSGSLRNCGWEVTVQSQNITRKKFSWTTNLNITFNRNKVLDLGENAYLPFNASNTYDEAFVLVPGQAVGTMYGLVYDGVYKFSDYKNFYIDNDPSKYMRPKDEWTAIYNDLVAHPTKAQLVDGVPLYAGSTPLPGNAKFRDLTGEGDINALDRAYIGSSAPKFFGGISNRFTLKDFDLNVFFQFSYGNDLFVSNYQALDGYGTRNVLQWIYDESWKPTPERQTDRWPSYMVDSYKTVTSNMWVEDGSYLKLKDVTLGYTLPRKLLSKIKMNTVRVYLTGQNLWTWTNFSWYDPETGDASSVTAGHYRFKYPSSRTFIFGVNIDF